ncbi:MAG: hypothetical protein IT567_00115 [Alphaproteobacteria bacterium]|nr:hypothetical protein [Alphaproteobacteria bacterium]
MNAALSVDMVPAPVMVTLAQEDWDAQLKDAERRGFEEGSRTTAAAAAEAEAALRNSYESGLTAMMEKINLQLLSLDGQQREFLKQCQGDLTKLALAIARKITGHETSHHAVTRIEQLVSGCLGQLFGEPEAVILVHETLVDALRTRIVHMAQQSGFAGVIRVEHGTGIPAGDCRVDWKNGAAEYFSGSLWNDIEQIVNRAGEAAHRDAAHAATHSPGAAPSMKQENSNGGTHE